METKVEKYLARMRDLERIKQPWLTHFQALAENFLLRKADFTSSLTPGQFLHDDIYDSTGQHAAHTAASVFLSLLWPDSSRTFTIKPVRRLKDQPGVEEYFNFVTEEMRAAFDNPRAGLELALAEYYWEKMVFGTGGIGTFEGPASDPSMPLVFESWDMKTMLISENAQGFVDTIMIKRSRTIRQVVQEYGASGKGDKIHPSILKKYNDRQFEERVEVLHIVEPKEAIPGKKGVAGMSCRTVHIDLANNFIMREKGYHEMPVAVSRMFKTKDDPYGYSPAMTALPTARSLDTISEAILVAADKQLDPPLGLLDNGRLGGGVIDTSSGALNVFNTAGINGSEKPIFPLFTVGELQSAKDLREQMKEEVMQSFFLDRLLDLNNKTQMTAYETSVRSRMRGETFGSFFARDIAEGLTPTISRGFNIMYRAGRLGVVKNSWAARVKKLWNKILGVEEVLVPEVIIQAVEAGLDVYEIEYISPAKRFMQAEKLQGIMTVLDVITTTGELLPGFKDNFDVDDMAASIVKYGGAPNTTLLTRDAVKKVRADAAQMTAAQNKLMAAKEMSEVGRNVAQATATLGGGAGGGQK